MSEAVSDSFELSLLTKAVKYQGWVARTVEPYLGNRIMEIGSGIGNMSRWLPARDRLILTEADPKLFQRLSAVPQFKDRRQVSVQKFDLMNDDLEPFKREKLDTIVSFNVLEHIEDDFQAVVRLREILVSHDGPRPRRLISFVPAHAWAYGEIDRSFAHFRRYSRSRWRQIKLGVAPEAKLTFRSFNLVGLLGWYVNGRLLKRNMIGDSSLAIFEKICPIVAPFDDVLHGAFQLPLGQSLIAILEF